MRHLLKVNHLSCAYDLDLCSCFGIAFGYLEEVGKLDRMDSGYEYQQVNPLKDKLIFVTIYDADQLCWKKNLHEIFSYIFQNDFWERKVTPTIFLEKFFILNFLSFPSIKLNKLWLSAFHLCLNGNKVMSKFPSHCLCSDNFFCFWVIVSELRK